MNELILHQIWTRNTIVRTTKTNLKKVKTILIKQILRAFMKYHISVLKSVYSIKYSSIQLCSHEIYLIQVVYGRIFKELHSTWLLKDELWLDKYAQSPQNFEILIKKLPFSPKFKENIQKNIRLLWTIKRFFPDSC